MGAGVLPIAFYNGKVYFLFGKECEYEDTAAGFSDFGGGTDNNETYLETASREGSEELTGFLGTQMDVLRLMKVRGTYEIIYECDDGKHRPYHTFLLPFAYDTQLTNYFNSNRAFIGKKLSKSVITSVKIFEKEIIQWIPIDKLTHMRPKFRFWYRNIIDKILEQRDAIEKFAKAKCGRIEQTNIHKTVKRRKRQKHT